MGIEHFSHSKTREPAMKGVGRVLNAAELLIKKNVKMANFMLCLFYYPKNVWENFFVASFLVSFLSASLSLQSFCCYLRGKGFVLLKPSTDWLRTTHIREDNLLYLVH